MKTKLMSLVILMTVIIGVAVAADPVKPKVVVVNHSESGIFKVIYEGEKSQRVNLKIYDQSGSVVFSEVIKSENGFIRPINFNQMQPGEYVLEINDSFGTNVQKIKYDIVRPVSTIHLAKVAGGSKYLLATGNVNIDEKVDVRVFDGNNNLVHNETVTLKSNTALLYNLKNVNGVPVFEVVDRTGTSKVIDY